MVQSPATTCRSERQRYKKPMPIIGADPKLQVLQDFPKIVAFFGYPGPSTPRRSRKSANLFVLPDMFIGVSRRGAYRGLDEVGGRGVPADLRQVQARMTDAPGG